MLSLDIAYLDIGMMGEQSGGDAACTPQGDLTLRGKRSKELSLSTSVWDQGQRSTEEGMRETVTKGERVGER